jgi:hypothetical protein
VFALCCRWSSKKSHDNFSITHRCFPSLWPPQKAKAPSRVPPAKPCSSLWKPRGTIGVMPSHDTHD